MGHSVTLDFCLFLRRFGIQLQDVMDVKTCPGHLDALQYSVTQKRRREIERKFYEIRWID